MRRTASVLALALVLGAVATGCGTAREQSGAQRIVLEPSGAGDATDGQLDQSVDVMRRRLEKAGVAAAKVKREQHQVVVELPGSQTRDVLRLLVRVGRLEFFDLQGDLTGPSIDKRGSPLPSTSQLRPREGTAVVTCGTAARYCPGVPGLPTRTYSYLFKYDPENKEHPVPELTGSDLRLQGTRQEFDSTSAQPIVLMQFTNAGARKFEGITRTLAERGRIRYAASGSKDPFNYMQQFAIVLDGEMKSAPTIDFTADPEGIPGDNGAQINGLGSLQEAKDLALVLQSGALPLAFHVVAE